MNIFFHELKKSRFISIIWSSILLGLLLIFMILYPIYYSHKNSILTSLQNVSNDALEAFNINKDNMFTPLGYYCFIFIYITIVGAFYAGFMGLKIMINDTLEGANEFLLTKPLPRKKILNSKVYAAVSSLFVSHLIYQIISIILMLLFKGHESLSISHLILINFSLFLIQITFLFICMTIGAYIKKPRAIILTTIITIFSFYLLSILENMIDNIILRYINPFSYFKANEILSTGFYNRSFIFTTIFIIFFCFNFSYGSYENDDIIGG